MDKMDIVAAVIKIAAIIAAEAASCLSNDIACDLLACAFVWYVFANELKV